MESPNTARPRDPARARGAGRVLAAAAGAVAFLVLVAASPARFFALATPLCAVWMVLSARAAPAGLARRLVPRAIDLALGVGSGVALYVLSRGFLWAACGVTRVLCGPLEAMFVRFETRTALAALALGLVLAPAEELFWRGVVQARLVPRLGAVRGVAAATLVAAVASLASGEPLLALAMLPTYGAWGALAAWRGSLVPAIPSHATWSVLVAAVLPPV